MTILYSIREHIVSLLKISGWALNLKGSKSWLHLFFITYQLENLIGLFDQVLDFQIFEVDIGVVQSGGQYSTRLVVDWANLDRVARLCMSKRLWGRLNHLALFQRSLVSINVGGTCMLIPFLVLEVEVRFLIFLNKPLPLVRWSPLMLF